MSLKRERDFTVEIIEEHVILHFISGADVMSFALTQNEAFVLSSDLFAVSCKLFWKERTATSKAQEQ